MAGDGHQSDAYDEKIEDKRTDDREIAGDGNDAKIEDQRMEETGVKKLIRVMMMITVMTNVVKNQNL